VTGLVDIIAKCDNVLFLVLLCIVDSHVVITIVSIYNKDRYTMGSVRGVVFTLLLYHCILYRYNGNCRRHKTYPRIVDGARRVHVHICNPDYSYLFFLLYRFNLQQTGVLTHPSILMSPFQWLTVPTLKQIVCV
jgi:hypothetical protein